MRRLTVILEQNQTNHCVLQKVDQWQNVLPFTLAGLVYKEPTTLQSLPRGDAAWFTSAGVSYPQPIKSTESLRKTKNLNGHSKHPPTQRDVILEKIQNYQNQVGVNDQTINQFQFKELRTVGHQQFNEAIQTASIFSDVIAISQTLFLTLLRNAPTLMRSLSCPLYIPPLSCTGEAPPEQLLLVAEMSTVRACLNFEPLKPTLTNTIILTFAGGDAETEKRLIQYIQSYVKTPAHLLLPTPDMKLIKKVVPSNSIYAAPLDESHVSWPLTQMMLKEATQQPISFYFTH